MTKTSLIVVHPRNGSFCAFPVRGRLTAAGLSPVITKVGIIRLSGDVTGSGSLLGVPSLRLTVNAGKSSGHLHGSEFMPSGFANVKKPMVWLSMKTGRTTLGASDGRFRGRDSRRQMRHLPPQTAADVERPDLAGLVACRVWSRVGEGDHPAVRAEREGAASHKSASTIWEEEGGQSAGWAQLAQAAAIGAHEEDALLFRRQMEWQRTD